MLKGIDVATATEATDDSSLELDNLERQSEVSTLPSGSRLNPDAPDFVPGLSAGAGLLAIKIVNELSDYPRWSNAASDTVDTYGPRYDSIWRENCLRAEMDAEAVVEALNASGIESPTRIEFVGDGGQQSPMDKRSSKAASDLETTSTATTTVNGRCCDNCALM
ncbi:uncharacterized protein LOC117565292 [Drosophila albomicans]|uniref:Uncharacterized protein LOC117565292 n=1 Tax=Drosophila albomicans TaxID=7291 RepID=A0A6P8W981_DROAB|nr:uncharacterized protein LOC117565292 [Drosophila albomicans]